MMKVHCLPDTFLDLVHQQLLANWPSRFDKSYKSEHGAETVSHVEDIRV